MRQDSNDDAALLQRGRYDEVPLCMSLVLEGLSRRLPSCVTCINR
jgi:hypothetical protein